MSLTKEVTAAVVDEVNDEVNEAIAAAAGCPGAGCIVGEKRRQTEESMERNPGAVWLGTMLMQDGVACEQAYNAASSLWYGSDSDSD